MKKNNVLDHGGKYNMSPTFQIIVGFVRFPRIEVIEIHQELPNHNRVLSSTNRLLAARVRASARLLDDRADHPRSYVKDNCVLICVTPTSSFTDELGEMRINDGECMNRNRIESFILRVSHPCAFITAVMFTARCSTKSTLGHPANYQPWRFLTAVIKGEPACQLEMSRYYRKTRVICATKCC